MRVYMKKIKWILLFIFSFQTYHVNAQTYFPPIGSQQWDTISPQSLGWCTNYLDSTIKYVEDNDSKAFIILYDGKIVVEKYFGTFVRDSIWYWASAGKSLTSCLVSIAEYKGLLNINDSSSIYLGNGWTSCTAAAEGKITIKNINSARFVRAINLCVCYASIVFLISKFVLKFAKDFLCLCLGNNSLFKSPFTFQPLCWPSF